MKKTELENGLIKFETGKEYQQWYYLAHPSEAIEEVNISGEVINKGESND